MATKRPDTPLADSPDPDYRNIKTSKKSFFKEKPYTPTATDSSYYKQGFDRAVEGKSVLSAYDMKTKQGMLGYKEAKERGLTKKK